MLIEDLQQGGLYEKLLEGRRLTKRERERWEELQAEYHLDANGRSRNQGVVARCLGVSRQTVNRWKNDESCPMPVETDGRYNPVIIHHWCSEFHPNSADPGQGETSEKSVWDTHRQKYQALKAEAEYRQMIGELIYSAKVEQLFVTRATELKKSLQAWARRLSLRLADRPADQIMEVLDEEVRLLLEVYSRPDALTNTADNGREEVD